MNNHYGDSWDMYVKEVFQKMKRPDSVYPGDEWGNKGWWDICYDRLLKRAGAAEWKHAVEIGAGSGKYTSLLFERSKSDVLAFDVSREFLTVLESRLESEMKAGRLRTCLLPCVRADEMLTQIEEAGLRGKLDGFFSIDAMVHVDLQYLAAYFVTAAICLRPGGKLVLTLADATSHKGRRKLMDDIKLYYPKQGVPSLKFEFISPDIVKSTMEELGFRIECLENESPEFEGARDMFLIAAKTSPDTAALEKLLR